MGKPVAVSKSSELLSCDIRVLYARKEYIEGLIRSLEQYHRLTEQPPQRIRKAA